jgi:hypothetical protein
MAGIPFARKYLQDELEKVVVDFDPRKKPRPEILEDGFLKILERGEDS